MGEGECRGWRDVRTGSSETRPSGCLTPALPLGSCCLLNGSFVRSVLKRLRCHNVKSDLRNQLSNLLMTTEKRIKEAAWTERTGNIIVCLHTRCPFSQVYLGEVVYEWWATFEPDTEVRETKTKDTVSRQEYNFKISFNSLLGSKKHRSKQNNKSKTKCYIEKLKKQNAAYSGSFSWGTCINLITRPRVLLLGKRTERLLVSQLRGVSHHWESATAPICICSILKDERLFTK